MMVAGFVGITVIALFITFMLLYARKKGMQKDEEVKEFASKNGFDYKAERRMMYLTPILTGTKEGLDFKITEKVVGTGKSKKVYSTLTFADTPFDFQFSIARENFLSNLGKFFGYRDIEFQNAEFDKTYLLKSEDEDQFRIMMDYKLQGDFSNLAGRFTGIIENEAGVMTYTCKGEINAAGNFGHLEEMIDFMVSFIKSKRK